jgi:hypothetical protein
MWMVGGKPRGNARVEGAEKSARPLTIQELTDLRRKTEVISKFLHDRLSTHLETLRPILLPERLFGKYLSGKGDSALADRAYAQLQQGYKPFSARPFELPTEFDQHWLSLVGNRLTLYPWEYTYEATTDRESKTISMTSPVRWVVSFSSAYTLTQVRQALTGRGERRVEHIRQFVVNALVTQLITSHTPGLATLFADLRYELQVDTAPELPKLPLTTIACSLPSFRPADDLILSAAGISGIPAFIELIDVGGLSRLEDPLKQRAEELLR